MVGCSLNARIWLVGDRYAQWYSNEKVG